MILFCWVCLLLFSAYTNIPLHYFFFDLFLSTGIFISFSECLFECFSLSFNVCLYLFIQFFDHFVCSCSAVCLIVSFPSSSLVPCFSKMLDASELRTLGSCCGGLTALSKRWYFILAFYMYIITEKLFRIKKSGCLDELVAMERGMSRHLKSFE